MTPTSMPTTFARPGLIPLIYQGFRLTERLPLSIVQFAARIATGMVFWNSAQSKLASWDVTLQLFEYEYAVPVLPTEIAARLATTTELLGAIFLFVGLAARFSSLALLGLVAVIQLFVYPGHWAEHLLWASTLGLILARGAGVISIDHVIRSVVAKE